MGTNGTQLREKVTFRTGTPQEIELEYTSEGDLQTGKAGDEYRFFLGGHRIMWVPPEVREAILSWGYSSGDRYAITKAKDGWKVQPLNLERKPAIGPAQQPPRTTVHTPARPPDLDAKTAAVAAQWDVSKWPAPQPAPGASEPRPITPATADLAAALMSAIDAATEAAAYASRKGLTLAWTAGDIRAMAATLYIGARQ